MVPAIVAGEYYVARHAFASSDSNPGTEARPLLTIQRAVDMARPGDSIHVKEGIYRGAITMGVSGTEAAPITLMAYGDDRPVISGAGRISGWKPCTREIAKGNPHYGNIYYVDIDRRITTLYQDNVRRWKSRMPEHGFWRMEGGTATTIQDTHNLTQADDFWIGAELFNRIAATEALVRRRVVDATAKQHARQGPQQADGNKERRD